MRSKLVIWVALAANALAIALNAGWLTSAAGRHAAGLGPAELLGLGTMSLLLLAGPAAALAVILRQAPARVRAPRP